MKYLSLFILFSTSVGATTLGRYYSSPEGTSVQKFSLSKSSVIYEKRSNFFDEKPDNRLGTFETSEAKSIKEDKQKLDAILVKVKTVDEFMKKRNESFNDLSMKNPHSSFFMLEDYRISQESDLYPEVKAIYERLSDLNWKQKKGIKLSEDLKKIIHVKDGKEVSNEIFNFAFQCQKSEPPSICSFKDEGILYVK
ncbi:hypothetical protein ACJVC5_06160 [Peredibacter sp. HCB2-198]|uniref:hypothetical protein n=1 Tax=Peredibacter sp. HCB2-198 TaxID=3383025 RepID=UPI0038B47952